MLTRIDVTADLKTHAVVKVEMVLPPALAETAVLALLALARSLDPRCRARPGRPGPITLATTGQAPGGSMILTATMPEKTAPDVASFEFTYTVDGAAQVKLTSAGEPVTFPAPVGSTVVGTVVEIDAAGNRSEPSEPVTLVVVDGISPPKPGAFGLTVTGQD